MKRLTTKMMAFVLVLTLLCSLLPLSAMAQEADVTADPQELADTGAYEDKGPSGAEGTVTLYFKGGISQEIVYPYEGNGLETEPYEDKLVYDVETNTLTMNNLEALAVEASAMGALTLVVKGENHLNDITVFGYEGYETLTITGDGSIDLDMGISIEDAAQLTIEDGVTLTASDGIIYTYYDPEGPVAVNGYALENPLVIKGRELSGGVAGHEKLDAVPLKEDHDPTWTTTARVYRNTSKPFSDNSRFKDTEYFAVYGLGANEVRKEDGIKHNCYKFAVNEAIYKDGEYYVGSHIDFLYAWDDSLLYKMFSNNLSRMRISDIDPSYVQVDLNKTDEDAVMLLDADGYALSDIVIVPSSSDALNRPRVTTTELPDAVEGKEYSAQVSAEPRNKGGKIVDYSLTGMASKWLSIDSSGRLTGKAPGFGIYQAIVTATEEVNGERTQSPSAYLVVKVDVPDVCVTFAKTLSDGCSHTLTITDSKGKTVRTLNLGSKDLRPDAVYDLSDLPEGSYTATLNGTITGAQAIFYNNSEAFTVASGQRTMVILDPDVELNYGENTLLVTVTNINEASDLKDITATVTLSNGKVYKKEVARRETLFPDVYKGANIAGVTLTAKDDAGQVFEIASSDSAELTIDTDTFKTYRAYCYQYDISGIRLNLNGFVFDVEAWDSYTFKTLDEDHMPKFVSADMTDDNKKKYYPEPEITLGTGDSFYITFEEFDRSGSISGTVCDEDGEPVAEAAVTCSQTIGGSLISRTATTDADGNYSFNNLYMDMDATISAAKTGYQAAEKSIKSVGEDSVLDLTLIMTGGVTVYSSDYVYDAKLTWSGAASGVMNAGDGYSFVLPIAKTVNGKITVSLIASNIAGMPTGTVTVKNGRGELSLKPALKGTIDWSGADGNTSYTGFSLKIVGKDYSRLFAPRTSGYIDVDPGEYTISILKPESNAAYATQKLTVEANKTVYVTAALPADAQRSTVSSGTLTGPRSAAKGETYQLKGLLTSIDGKEIESLKFTVGDSYSWDNNIQHVVVNGKKAKIANGYVKKSDNPELDWSLPLNFTVYCSQRADAKSPVQTVSAYVVAGNTSLIGSVVTRYIPKLTLSTVRAIGSTTDKSQRKIPDAISFVGHGEANTEIKLYDNGTLCAVVMTDDKGNYSGELTPSGIAYYHTIRAEAVFGGEKVSAQSRCTYRSDGAVLQSLMMNGSKISISGGRLAYTTTPTGTVQFTAKFKNADMLDDITMSVNGKNVTSKVFFKVSNISGYELLPATSDKSGSTWTSEVYAHGADYPTGVQTIYLNKEVDNSYTVALDTDTASVGADEEDGGLAETGVVSTTFTGAVERIDSYDKNNYRAVYDYESLLKEIEGDSNVMRDESLSAAEKSSKLYELVAEHANKESGTKDAKAITAEDAAQRCPSGVMQIRSFTDAPKYTVTDQNVKLQKDELEGKGYKSYYYKDRTSGREMCMFTGTFYYDKDAKPVDNLYVTNIYNGVPTIEEDKRMFNNGTPLGSTLDVIYLCDLTAKKWIRIQTAIISPNGASPIHTFSTQIPCKLYQPNEYKEYAVNLVSTSSSAETASTGAELAATGDSEFKKNYAGNSYSINLGSVSPATYGSAIVSATSFGVGHAMSKGALATPQILSKETVEDLKLVCPKTGKLLGPQNAEFLGKFDYGSFAASDIFKNAGDIVGGVLPGSTAANDPYDYLQRYLTDNIHYYGRVQEVAGKTDAKNNGGRMGDFRNEALMAKIMKQETADMQNAVTEVQAAIEDAKARGVRTDDVTNKLSYLSCACAVVPVWGYMAAGGIDAYCFLASAARDTNDAKLISALEKFDTTVNRYIKRDKENKETFQHTDEIIKRNRDKYPDTKTIQELLDEKDNGNTQPRFPDDPPADNDNDPDEPVSEGEGDPDNDCDLEPVHDPSGVVYEAVLSNPVEGASVTLYRYEDDDDPLTVWDDSNYLNQDNPLITDENGFYRWDVPEGEWYVTASKDGYASGSSQNDREATVRHGALNYLPVLPPQLEVNIPLVSYAAPEVESVSAKTDGVYITFSKYMDETALTADSFTLTDASGKTVSFKLEKLDSEQAPSNIKYDGAAPSYTKTVRLTAKLNSGAKLTLHVADTLRSYADVAMASAYNDALTVADKETLNVPTFSITQGEVDKGTLVTVTCEDGAAIIYTTDGTEPSATNGTRAESGVQISLIIDTTIKAIAVRSDAKSSEIAAAEYTVIKYQGSETGTTLLLGDTDGDGDVTILDATIIQRHLASLPTSVYIEEVADTDGDGSVTILDATGIQRWLAGLSSPEGIGKPI